MALAEVVERDAVAVLAQVADGLRDDGLIFNKGRFRDFDLEVDSRQSVLFGQVIENPDRVRHEKVAARQVEYDRHNRQFLSSARVEILHGHLGDEVVEQVDLVVCFEHGYEVVRGDVPVFWIVPACQRLKGADLAR